MTPKKKDSPELFEVFRSAVRDREGGASDDPEAVSSAERESLVAEAPEAPEPPRRAAAPPAEPDPPSGMGERRVALRYNSVVLGLMATVGLVFVAFAMGVRWGEDRATKRAPADRNGAPTEEDARLAEQLGPLAAPPDRFTGTPPVNAQAAVDPGLPSENVVRPPAPTRTDPQPQPPAGKWWVRLIDFDVTEASTEALVATHLRKLKEKGFDQVCGRPLVSRGKKVLAVCLGPFQTKAQATQALPRVKAANPSAYKYADPICDE